MSKTRSERLNEKSENTNETTPVIHAITPVTKSETTTPESPENEFANQISEEQFKKQSEGIETYNKNFHEMLSQETNLEDFNEVTGEILTRKMFVDGERKDFIFTGFSDIPDQQTGEPRKCAVLVGKEGTFYAPSFVIVSACEKLTKTPIRVAIISLGMKEGKTNNYWNAKVYSL